MKPAKSSRRGNSGNSGRTVCNLGRDGESSSENRFSENGESSDELDGTDDLGKHDTPYVRYARGPYAYRVRTGGSGRGGTCCTVRTYGTPGAVTRIAHVHYGGPAAYVST